MASPFGPERYQLFAAGRAATRTLVRDTVENVDVLSLGGADSGAVGRTIADALNGAQWDQPAVIKRKPKVYRVTVTMNVREGEYTRTAQLPSFYLGEWEGVTDEDRAIARAKSMLSTINPNVESWHISAVDITGNF